MKRLISPFLNWRWLAIAILALTFNGCSQTTVQSKSNEAAKQAQAKLSLKYAKHYIDNKNFEEAARFVEAVPTDPAFANDVANLRKEIESLSAAYDETIRVRYTEEATVPINMSVETKSCDGSNFVVNGKALLPPRTRLTASLWREESPGNWKKVVEELTEVGSGSNFQAVLPAYNKQSFVREEWEKFFAVNFEVRITSRFLTASDQPASVLKLVGESGKKLSGDFIEQREDGKYINYTQKYSLKTEADPGATSAVHCVHIKLKKI